VKTKVVLLAAVVAVMVSGGSQARSVGDLRERVVDYSDLNLNSSAGAAVLYQRITRAAHAVCDLPIPWDATAASRVRNCVHAARARSVSEVNAPELTRYFESRQKASVVVAMGASQL
jgi:UrcA family protein